MIVLALLACHNDPPPLGMILKKDGQVYAGAAVVDITPEITETFDDLDGDHTFEGCLDKPDGKDCQYGTETFHDTNGNGRFDAVFMGGFGPMRPANEVHDPITVRAVVIAQDEQYFAFVGMDLVGLGSPRIHAARDALVADGFDGDRLIAASTHNHQGPDTMGLWGFPYDFANPVSGMNPDYQDRVSAAIEQAVREAAGAMEAVDLRVGRVNMRDRGPWFNGSMFGGKNPTPIMHGMIHDGRDPIVVSDQLLVVQGNRPDGGGTVFTWTNWSGHPETRGGDNNAISSDWVGVAREVLEAEYGGVALHMPESLGGMQSALSGDVPLVDPDGTHELSGVIDADGDDVPVWAEHESWEFVTSHGWHIAEAAEDALAAGEDIKATPMRIETETMYVPIENVAYNLIGTKGVFDLGLEDAVTDPALCPEAGLTAGLGCLPTRTSRLQVGPIGYVAVPGELLPEVGWGLPTDDPEWNAEVDDPTKRGEGARYFPQHDHDCDAIPYNECAVTDKIGQCDCLSMHAIPYTLSPDPAQQPLLDALDTKYRAVLGMTDNYLSYIIPEPDFNTHVSLLSPTDGDHYEDTVSPAHNFAMRVQQAQARIDARW